MIEQQKQNKQTYLRFLEMLGRMFPAFGLSCRKKKGVLRSISLFDFWL